MLYGHSLPNSIRYAKQAQVIKIMICSSRQKRRKHEKLKKNLQQSVCTLYSTIPLTPSFLICSIPPKLTKTALRPPIPWVNSLPIWRRGTAHASGANVPRFEMLRLKQLESFCMQSILILEILEESWHSMKVQLHLCIVMAFMSMYVSIFDGKSLC